MFVYDLRPEVAGTGHRWSVQVPKREGVQLQCQDDLADRCEAGDGVRGEQHLVAAQRLVGVQSPELTGSSVRVKVNLDANDKLRADHR